MTTADDREQQLVTPPDGAERLTAALGGRQWRGPHDDPPPFAAQPTGLEPLQQRDPEGGTDGSA